MDTTAVLAELGNASTAIGAIGGALLGVAGVLVAFRWARRALF